MHFYLSFAFLLVLSISQAFASQREVYFRIIHTTDIHGALFPFDFINNEAQNYGLAQVYTYVKQERSNDNQRVILLDGGDILQGQPTVYYSNYIDSSESHIVSRVMNYMGYDAATPGNHDIGVGPDVYNQVACEFQFPWLGANIIDTRTGNTYFKPYHIIDYQGARVAILGLTTPAIPQWFPSELWPHMEFKDMVTSAKAWMDTIRIKENPHLIIGLFHSGTNGTSASTINGGPVENASLLVAQNVPGFDLILTGHSHEPIDTTVVDANGGRVHIVNPGAWGRAVSSVEINITLGSDGAALSKQVSSDIVEMRNTMPNPEYISYFSEYYQSVNDFVDRPIGYFRRQVDSRDALFGPSAFVGILHSVQLAISNAQISFASPLSFNSTIKQGEVYIRDLFKIYPYDYLLYIVNLTGKEIREYLEYTADLWFSQMESADDNLLRFRNTNGNGNGNSYNPEQRLEHEFYYFDSAMGIRYVVDVSKPKGEMVTIESLQNGAPFDEEETYRVAINSNRGSGGGGHLTLGVGLTADQIRERIVGVSSNDMRYYLMRWVEMLGRVVPENPNNWAVEPHDWVQQAAERDYNRLFGNEQL